MPASPAENPTLDWPQFFLELVPLGTHPINVGEHSFQQGFGRGRGDARALKLADFAALAVDLRAHPLDFGSELIKLHVAKAFLICRRTAAVGRPSFSRSRKRFHSLMISRSLPASMPYENITGTF